MLMLMPDMLLYCIMTERGLKCFPSINKQSIRLKRYWNSRTPEQRQAFSAMRSEVQKKTFENNPKLRKIRAKSFKKATTDYWKNVEEEKKKEHIQKMSEGMKEAWDNEGDNFGSRLANNENITKLNGNVIVEHDVPRINDYCGVITESQMAELHG